MNFLPSWRTLFWICFGGILILAMRGSQCTPSLKKIFGPKEAMMLAFPDDTGRIRVRMTKDGLNWSTQDLPSTHVCLISVCQGVGGGSDENANIFAIAYQSGMALRVALGLWGSAWDREALVPPSNPLASTPDVVNVGGERWAVAFRRGDGTINVGIMDTGDEAFVIAGVEPLGGLNSSASSRPAIASIGTKVVLSWARHTSGGGTQLVASLGTIQNNSIIFQSPYEIPLPRTAELQGGFQSPPSVGRDSNRFYIAVVREELGTGAGTLHGWKTHVLVSSDGNNWSSHSSTAALEVVNASLVEIGGMTDGTLVMAAISPRSSDHGSAARYSTESGRWSALDRDVVYGSFRPAAKGFALTGVGSNPEN